MMGKAMRRRAQIIRLALRLYRRYRKIQRLRSQWGSRPGQARAEDSRDGDASLTPIDALYAAAGRDIRETANRLCGAMVKVGQFLSLREELFPLAFTRELQALQDDVPFAPFATVRSEIGRSCGQTVEEVFRCVDAKPVASGSLAQVHRAELRDGREVAVKILRSGIERRVKMDLSTLGLMSRIFGRLRVVRKRLDLVALHRVFQNTLSLELDMRSEAQHMDQLRKMFADDDRIMIPAVVPTYTKTRMLVMTYVRGANIRDDVRLQDWGVNRKTVRDALLDAYLRQLMVGGFVHLDPHPGNLLVLPDGRLAMLDFGMVGEYSVEERACFRNLVQRIYLRDLKGVFEILQHLGYIRKDIVVDQFLRDIAIGPGTLGKFDTETLSRVLGHEGFQLQANYMLLMRCISMLKTALTILTPDEDDWLDVLTSRAFSILFDASVPQTASL